MKLSFTTPLFLSLVLASLLLLDGVRAAGNEEDVIIESVGITSQNSEERISYQCTYRNLWTKERQPINYPEGLAHLAGPIMWTHTLQYLPWHAGFGVTRGVEKLAEQGFTDVLQQEMEQQGEQVLDNSEYGAIKWFVTERDYVHLPPLEASFLYPYMSMMASIQPSPDWYTGFYSFWLIDEYSRTWYDHLKIQTKPWDAGTDDGVSYESRDSDLDPQINVERFVPRNAPEGGELMSPDGASVPVVGELECFLVVGDQDLAMPDCDWFANPCCNETDKENCGALLPNGAVPKLTPELAEVRANGGGGNGAACNETDIENCGTLLPNGTTPELTPELEEANSTTDTISGAASLGLSFLVAGLAMVQWMLV